MNSEVVLLPRRPLPPENGVYCRNVETGETRLIRECEDPIHVFASAVAGAVCQCGEQRWQAPADSNVHLLGAGSEGPSIQEGAS